MAKYKAAPGAQYNDRQAQIIGKRLEALPAITPEAVIEDAQSKSSPLHPFFEWDNTAAAKNYRIFQARSIVNHLLVVVRTPSGKVETKAFHSVKVNLESDGEIEEQRVYISVGTAKRNPDLREQVIRSAKQELLRWQSRYEQYRDVFENVFEAIESISEELVPA